MPSRDRSGAIRLLRWSVPIVMTTAVTAALLAHGGRGNNGEGGGAVAVGLVKAAALADLNHDMNGQALLCGAGCTSEQRLSEQQVIDHLQPSLAVWSTSVRATKQAEEVRAWLSMQTDSTYVPYSAFRWDVAKWVSVSIHSTSASAIFEGKGDYLTNGKWQPDEILQQVQLKLVLEDGSWKLLDQEVIYQ